MLDEAVARARGGVSAELEAVAWIAELFNHEWLADLLAECHVAADVVGGLFACL